jgi:hypothetical protein
MPLHNVSVAVEQTKENNGLQQKHIPNKNINKKRKRKYRQQVTNHPDQLHCNISMLVFLISLVFCYFTYFLLCIFQMFINILSHESYFIIFIAITLCLSFYKSNNISVEQAKKNE